MEDKIVTLKQKHIDGINELKEKPAGFNFSKYVRTKLEEDYPDIFKE